MFDRVLKHERRRGLKGELDGGSRGRERSGRRWACERLEDRVLLTVLTISGTSGNDYISLAGSGGSLIQVDVNSVITHYNPFDYTSVVIQGVGGDDTINILGTELPTTVVGAGQDTVTVGDTNGVQDITASLNITDPPNWADLTIDDSVDTVARNATVSNTSVTNLAPATISYSPQDLRSFTVNGGTGGNTFTVTNTPAGLGTTVTRLNSGTGADHVNVQGTQSNTVLNLQGQNGSDTVSITNAGSVQGIAGAINIENDGAFDALTIDDSADTTARVATFSTFTPGGDTPWESLTGLAPASIDYEGQDVNSATINGGSGGNTFNVFGIAAGFVAGTPTNLNTGTGADHVNVQTTAQGTVLNVQGQSSLDTVNLGSAGSVQNIKGTVNLRNAASVDNITMDDSADVTSRTIAIADFIPGGEVISFDSVTGLAPGTINFKLTDVGIVTINGGSGGNTFTVNSAPVANFETLNLNTGTGADHVNVLAFGALATLNVQGQNGIDTVDLSNAGSIQSILGTINVENDGSFDNLTIDDSADTVPINAFLYTFTPGGDTIWGKFLFYVYGSINYEAADILNPIVIKGGSGGNTFNITGTVDTTNLFTGVGSDQVNIGDTPAGTTLNVDGQNGSDTVGVGDAGSVQGIQGVVNIENTGAYDALTIDDSADVVARNATLSTFVPTGDTNWERLTGLAPGTINYELADVTTATVNGGGGGNTFNINGTAVGGGNAITLNTGAGNDTINVNATATVTTLTLNGQGGSDVINLNYISGNPLPHLVNLSGLFTVNGLQAGHNLNGTTLNLNRSTVYINYGNAMSDPLGLIQSYLSAGYNSGAWTGTASAFTGAINSLPAANNVNHNTGIGWADSADGTGVDTVPNTIELKYTLNGDTNLSGTVDIFDLNNLLPHYNKTGGWTGGDSTYNGTVDIFDLNALLPNYNKALGSQVIPGTAGATGAGVAVVSGDLAKGAEVGSKVSALVSLSSTPGAAIGTSGNSAGVTAAERSGYRKWRTRDVLKSRMAGG